MNGARISNYMPFTIEIEIVPKTLHDIFLSFFAFDLQNFFYLLELVVAGIVGYPF